MTRPNDPETRTALARTFDTAPDAYAARPPYPEEIFTLLVDRCGLGFETRVLEIGPGTGQATLPLLERGALVTAVEPGTALAERLAHATSERSIEIVNAAFESAEFADRAFDLVAAATSFHWVDPEVGLDKAARVLKPGGWLALWWTVFGDASRPDPFHEALRPLLDELAPELYSDAFAEVPYGLDIEARCREIDATGNFSRVEHHAISWEGHHTAVEIRELFGTFSPWLALPAERRTLVLDALEALARDRFGDAVTRPYVTSTFLAQRRQASSAA